jgi:plastocyanin
VDAADAGAYDPRVAKVRTLAVLAGCTALAACGGSSSPSAKHAAAPTATKAATKQPSTVAVTMRNIRFRPHRIVVHLGQTVRWTNDDQVDHTVASSALRLASEGIGPGKTFSYTPKRRGTFAYFCTIHAGQTGVLVVQ